MSGVVILVSGRRAYVWPVLQGSIENLAAAGARVTVGCAVAPPATLVDATPEVNWVPIDSAEWTLTTLDRSAPTAQKATTEVDDVDADEALTEEAAIEEPEVFRKPSTTPVKTDQSRQAQARAFAGKGVRFAKSEVRRTRRRLKHARRDARRALSRTDAVHVLTYRDTAGVWKEVQSNTELMQRAATAQLIVAYDLPMIRSAWELGQINTTAGVVLGQAGVDGALTAGMVG